MPRVARIEYEGAVFHVLARGNERREIARDDADRKRFVETLAEACGKSLEDSRKCLYARTDPEAAKDEA